MESKRLISFAAALSVAVSGFAGIGLSAAAEDTESIYNFSELTEEYARSKEASVFDGAVKLYSADEKLSPLSVSASVTSPLGNGVSVTSALKAKKLKATVHLAAGETVVEYYCGTDSGGSAAKNLDMVVQNSAGTTVATESNGEQKGGLKPYTISYTAETEGDYSIIDTQTTSNRTLVYAIAKTNGTYDAGATTAPATDDPSVTQAAPTAAPTATPKVTADPNAESEVKITRAAGWLESAYVTWTNPAAVDKYNVYVKPEGGSYTKLDDELVRYYGSYYRADALGLAAGSYQMKVEAVIGGSVKEAVESDVMPVSAYRREGFAFDSHSAHYNADGVGAYKNDGTLKDGAKVLYITDANKDTVTFDVVTDKGKGTVTTCTGLGEILAAREKNKAEDTPLAIRMIGQVEAPADVNSSKYMQIKSTSNITFEGVGEDATTYHWSFLVRETKNIEIRNVAVMEFYDDGISLDTNNFNDWVHNCDIFYGQNRGGDQKKGDGSLDVKSGSDYCTFSYNHFWDSGKTSLCGMKTDNNQGYHMTYNYNWFDHSDSRHPRVRGDQVHVYNNYYDGISKYGAGACTGSSVYVEKNVFRNCVHPVLTSMQGTDISDGKGTFSSEDGGSIKMFDNAIYGGIAVVYSTKDNISSDTDAYLAETRDEQVPSTYTAKQGGATYSNFDTASTMYSYSALDTDSVVDFVKLYAGRVQGGDFNHEFNDEVDDKLYDRDDVLGNALQSYKTSLKTEYVSGSVYPATEGTQPDAKPTAAPFDPSAQPTQKPGGGSSTSESTVIWRASDNAASIAAGTVLKADWLTLVGAGVDYKASNQAIGGVSLTGKVNAPSGQTAPTLKENGQNGAALKFTPDKDGSIKVYFKLNNGKIMYITDESAAEIASHENTTGASEYTTLSANVEAGKTYYAFGGGTNVEYWAAEYTTTGDYTDDDPDPEPEPSPTATADPDAPTPTATSAAPTPTATNAPSSGKVAVGTGFTWSADSLTAGDYTAPFSYDNVFVGAGAGTSSSSGANNQHVTVDASGNTFGDVKYTQRVKTNGKGDADTKIRVIYFTPDSDCTMTLNAMSSNNSTDRNISVRHGSSTEAIVLTGGEKAGHDVALKANEEVIIYSEEGAFNVFGIILTPAGDVNPTAEAPTPTAAAPTPTAAAPTPTAAAPTPTAAAPTTVPDDTKCVKITATYNENGTLDTVTAEEVPLSEATESFREDYTLVTYWDSLDSMKPVTAPSEEETKAPADPTDPPADDPDNENNLIWKAEDGVEYTAGQDLGNGLSLVFGTGDAAPVYTNFLTDVTDEETGEVTKAAATKTIGGIEFTGYVSSSANGSWSGTSIDAAKPTAVKYTAASSGILTIYLDTVASTKKICVGKDGMKKADIENAGTAGIDEPMAFELNVQANATYYIYVSGSKARFCGAGFKADSSSGGGEAETPTTPPSTDLLQLPKGTRVTFDAGVGTTYTANAVYGSYVSVFSNGSEIKVTSSNKTINGTKYSSRIQPGSKGAFNSDGTPKTKVIAVTPAESGTLTVDFASGSSGVSRSIAVKQGSNAATEQADSGDGSSVSVSVTAGTPVYIYSSVDAVNIYGIILN